MRKDIFGDGFVVADISLHEAVNKSIYILLQALLFIEGDIYFGSHKVS